MRQYNFLEEKYDLDRLIDKLYDGTSTKDLKKLRSGSYISKSAVGSAALGAGASYILSGHRLLRKLKQEYPDAVDENGRWKFSKLPEDVKKEARKYILKKMAITGGISGAASLVTDLSNRYLIGKYAKRKNINL